MLYRGIRDQILEVEPKIGGNFALFPETVTWSGVGSSPEAKGELDKQAGDAGFPSGCLSYEHADDMLAFLKSRPTGSQTVILASHLLDSDARHVELCQEIHRVLAPGGRYYFVEYNKAAPSTLSSALQTVYDPLRSLAFPLVNSRQSLTHACTESVLAAGFGHLYVEHWPNSKNRADPRDGVTRLETNREDNSVVGLPSGFSVKHVVAGVAVKK
jgi:hypothetical protein